MQKTIKEFLSAYHAGRVCVHPTDTVLGLTCNDVGLEKLLAFKNRPSEMGFVHLASDVETALSYWQPLPRGWEERLTKIFPAPLTVVWRADDSEMMGVRGETIAIRVSRIECAWFRECLQELGLIVSTSVNRHGYPPLSLIEAKELLGGNADFFVPPMTDFVAGESSTVIALDDDGGYEVLRGEITAFLADFC